jgi:hypothetical protein
MNVIFANIPHRRFLYGHDLVRGEITVLGSPGGVGKSTLAIGMAISIATGKELLNERIYGTDLRVVLINAEDSTIEIQRRVYAACMAHSVKQHDLVRLHIAGADHPNVQALSLLRANRTASELDPAGLTSLERLLEELGPDLVVLDPLVALCSNGNMNDNSGMSLAMRALKRLAIKFDCAILIVHHTRKGGEPGSADAISGAASIINLSRRSIMPVTLTADEALKLSIPVSERIRYFKLVDAKSNLVPRGGEPPIYHLHSVQLPNAEPPIYPSGDNVQAVTRVQFPLQPAGSGTTDQEKVRQVILDLAARGKEIDGRYWPYSPSPAGADNVRSIVDDAVTAAAAATAPRQWASGDLEAIVKAMIKKMSKDGTLVSRQMKELVEDAGRFRRGRGLQLGPSTDAKGAADADDIAIAA